MLSRLILYINTIKNLTFTQIFWRLFNLFKTKSLKYKVSPLIDDIKKNISNSFNGKKIFFEPNIVYIFNKKLKITNNFNWNTKDLNLLEVYTLNYLDILENFNNENNKYLKKIIHIWIKGNTDIRRSSWDPYPTSLRLVNLVKWQIRSKSNDNVIINSIYRQARWLNNNIEYHLLGNHLLANAKALIFCGIIFRNNEAKQWLEKGIKLFNKYIDKQTLHDGGHYERSPMYHSIVTKDILDLLNVLNIKDEEFEIEFRKKLEEKLDKYMNWASYMNHSDNQISFFGDTNFDASNSLEHLKNYYYAVKIKKHYFNEKREYFKQLISSGYIIIKKNAFKFIIDNGDATGLDQPGHTHAALLSYEMSLFDQRFIVNSGVSTYENNHQRQFERSTKAHNTIELNSGNSQQVWSSFRLARRGKVKKRKIEHMNDQIEISSSHNGFSGQKNRIGEITHKRDWKIYRKQIEIIDTMYGEYKEAISRIYFHPSIKIKEDLTCILPNNKKVKFEISGGKFKLVDTFWYPKYNYRIKNLCLEIKLNSKKLITKLII